MIVPGLRATRKLPNECACLQTSRSVRLARCERLRKQVARRAPRPNSVIGHYRTLFPLLGQPGEWACISAAEARRPQNWFASPKLTWGQTNFASTGTEFLVDLDCAGLIPVTPFRRLTVRLVHCSEDVGLF